MLFVRFKIVINVPFTFKGPGCNSLTLSVLGVTEVRVLIFSLILDTHESVLEVTFWIHPEASKMFIVFHVCVWGRKRASLSGRVNF